MAGTYAYTKVYPISADVDTVATQLAQRQSDVGTTNGGITASGGATTLPQLGVDAQNLGLAYFKGMADSIMCAVGYQSQNDTAGLGLTNTSSTVYGQVGDGSTTGFAPWTFVAPLSRTYVVHVDLSFYLTAITGVGKVFFRLLVDGAAYATNGSSQARNVTNDHTPKSFRIAVPMLAGSRVLKLQWKVDAATTTAAVDANDILTFTVTG